MIAMYVIILVLVTTGTALLIHGFTTACNIKEAELVTVRTAEPRKEELYYITY